MPELVVSLFLVEKFLGLALIVGSGVCGAGAWFIEARYLRRILFGIAIVSWVVALFAFLGLLALESADTSSTGSIACPVATASSELAPGRWSNFPPGEVCEYASGDVGPTYWRVPAALLLVVVPIGVVAMGLRRRDDAEVPPAEFVNA